MSESLAKSSDGPRLQSWFYLGLVVAAYGIFNLLFTPFNGPESFPRLMAMGVIFAQPIHFACWLVMGPPPLTKRIPITIAVAILATLLTGFSSRGEFPFLVLPGFFVVWSVLILVLAKLAGWRIVNARRVSDAKAQVNQFSLKYLLSLMTVCAILLGIGRVLASKHDLSPSGSVARNLVDNVIIPIGFITLAMIPSIVVPLLVLSRWPTTRVLIIIPLAWAALTWLAVTTIVAIQPYSDNWEVTRAVVALQLGAAIAGLFAATVVRYCGYRLLNRKTDPEIPAATNP